MYGCELLFTKAEAAEVKAQVRKAVNGPCPCDEGKKCPLLPADIVPLLRRLDTPRKLTA
jgi:hypothetical protein